MAMTVAFAGKIGTGKTEITKALAQTLGWIRASFGDYVRNEVHQLGLPQTRENLQVIGTQLLRQNPSQFCSDVLAFSGWRPGNDLLIDGLRHSETIEIIQRLIRPAAWKIVFLTVPEVIRTQRLRQREQWTEDALANVESHSSELQVSSVIRNLADIEVDTGRPLATVTSEILEWIENQRSN